jgi:hypothetical protein
MPFTSLKVVEMKTDAEPALRAANDNYLYRSASDSSLYILFKTDLLFFICQLQQNVFFVIQQDRRKVYIKAVRSTSIKMFFSSIL